MSVATLDDRALRETDGWSEHLSRSRILKVVSDLLGHSSPTITLSIYGHVLPGMAEEACERFSSMVLG